MLTYIFRQKYTATPYLQYGDGATAQLPYQSPEELRLIYQTINMDFRRTSGIYLNAPFRVGHVWDATATVNVYNQRERATDFHDIGHLRRHLPLRDGEVTEYTAIPSAFFRMHTYKTSAQLRIDNRADAVWYV